MLGNKKISPVNLGTLRGFGTVAALCSDILGISFTPDAYEKISDRIIK